MNLIHTLYLALNVTDHGLSSTSLKSAGPTRAANVPTCAAKSKDYDAGSCYSIATGFTKERLKEKVYNDTREVVPDPNCDNGEFYVFSFEEFEGLHPDARSCQLSTYAAVVQAAALDAPCRTRDKERAKLLMVPPYTAVGECNWPAYGQSCNGADNVFRRRKLMCTVFNLTGALLATRRDYPDKQVLVVDVPNAPDTSSVPTGKFEDPGVTFATANALYPCYAYRRGLDISLPPAASPRCHNAPGEAFSEALGDKRYFLSFKGQLRTPFRRHLKEQLHNGKDVIFAGPNETEHDFDELLYRSRFNLILGGDVEFSYRFVEAVCSGGVPVLLNYQWVPPFHEFVPFGSYGVLMSTHRSSSGELLSRLKNLTDAEVEEKRSRAETVCKQYFASMEVQVRALIRELLAHPQELDQGQAPARDVAGEKKALVFNKPEGEAAELEAVGVDTEPNMHGLCRPPTAR